MNFKKISNFALAFVCAVILFIISTILQSKIIRYEETVEVLVSNEDIEKGKILSKEMFSTKKINKSIAVDSKMILKSNNIEGKVSQYDISKNQIMYENFIGENKNFEYLNFDNDCELISLKMNGMATTISNQVREGDIVNVNFIGKYKNIMSMIPYLTIYPSVSSEEEYVVVGVLEKVKVMGIYNSIGENITEQTDDKIIDTVSLVVHKDKIKLLEYLTPNGDFYLSRT